MAGNPVLKNTVMSVLREQAAWSFNFQYNEFLVRGERYQTVVMLLSQDRITCEIGVPQNDATSTGTKVVAKYDPNKHVFRFPSETYGSNSNLGDEKRTIVHEATHAMHDVFLQRRCAALDDEATGWLAGALYTRLKDNLKPQNEIIKFTPPVEIGGAMDTSLKLADKILAATKFPEVAHLHDGDMVDLKAAIADLYNRNDPTNDITKQPQDYSGVP